jgi:glycosyltransferase involved in cell wall biosynthesis
MASGLPVVVTDTGGTAELVREDENGYIVAWADVPALAGALVRLVEDQAKRQQMGQRSRQLASQFSWPIITREYLELCASIATQAQPKPASSRRLAFRRLMVSDE